MIGDGAVLELSGDRNEILVLTTGLGRGPSRNGGVVRASDPCREIEIVGREILHDTNVLDPCWERPDPPGGDLEDVAGLAVLKALLQLLQRRVVALDVTDAADQPGGVETITQRARRLHGVGERFLDEGVDAGFTQQHPHVEVIAGRSGYDRHVDALIDQPTRVVEYRGPASGTHRISHRVGHPGEFDPVDLGDHAGMVAAHLSESHHADSQHLAHETASTMVARSSSESAGCTGSDSTSAAAFAVSGRSRSRSKLGRRWVGIG